LLDEVAQQLSGSFPRKEAEDEPRNGRPMPQGAEISACLSHGGSIDAEAGGCQGWRNGSSAGIRTAMKKIDPTASSTDRWANRRPSGVRRQMPRGGGGGPRRVPGLEGKAFRRAPSARPRLPLGPGRRFKAVWGPCKHPAGPLACSTARRMTHDAPSREITAPTASSATPARRRQAQPGNPSPSRRRPSLTGLRAAYPSGGTPERRNTPGSNKETARRMRKSASGLASLISMTYRPPLSAQRLHRPTKQTNDARPKPSRSRS
jgi:hypothetical protein